jgi:Leucine-rich repeat (LRR) protein
VNLEDLNCSVNNLISLDVSNCEKITRLDCHDNQLTNVTLILPKKGKKLTVLDLSRNNLTDLSIFSHLENLKTFLSKNNPFVVNLESLKNLKKLEHLDDIGDNVNPT